MDHWHASDGAPLRERDRIGAAAYYLVVDVHRRKRLNWHLSHRAWNKLMYALHGNFGDGDVQVFSVTMWNVRALSFGGARVGEKVNPSATKLRVLETEIATHRPTTVGMLEVETSSIAAMRRWASSMQ